MIQTSNKIGRGKLEKLFAVLCMFLVVIMVYAGADAETKNAELLDSFIKSKGYKDCIILAPSNIKQFWTDKSVLNKNDLINVMLKQEESIPYKIQLANVLETQDCKIEIITESPDLSFSVLTSDNKVISSSSREDDFIQYNVVSSTFHLEDTNDFAFYCSFSSKDEIITLKRIVISFSENPNSVFAGSPGFDKLLEKIEAEGKEVPDSDAKCLVMKDLNKVFVRVPKEVQLDTWIYYHIYPMDEKDLLKGREQYKFNNADFIPLKKHGTLIPKPYSSKSDYSIIQINLPSYQYRTLYFGQSKDNKQLFRVLFNNNTPE